MFPPGHQIVSKKTSKKDALGSLFGTQNGKSALQKAMKKKKRENTTWENMQNYSKSVSKLENMSLAF